MLGIPGFVLKAIPLLIIFGISIISLLSGAVQCTFSENHNCDRLLKDAAGLAVAPDEMIYSGVNTIHQVDANSGLFYDANSVKDSARAQIYLGLFVFIIWIAMIFSFIYKKFSSGSMDIFYKFLVLVVIILIIAVLQFMYIYWSGEPGLPFRGIAELFKDPTVLDSGSNFAVDQIVENQTIT